MALELFEHVKTITYTPESGDGTSSSADASSLGGCQSVTVQCDNTEIEHSACDDAAIAYRGLTAKTLSGTVELAGVQLARDLGSLSFGPSIPHLVSFEFSETGNERSFSGDGKCWVQHISIDGRSVEATANVRAALTALGMVDGSVYDLAVKYLKGDTPAVGSQGCAGNAAVEIAAELMMLTSCNLTARHNDYADYQASWKGTGGTKDVAGGPALSGIHVGNVGTLAWVIPSAIVGNPGISISVRNTVITGKRITLEQGGMLRESFTYRSYGLDPTDETPMTFSAAS